MIEVYDQWHATQANPADKLDSAQRVAAISENFNYNPDYLSRLLKKHTGHSVVQFVNMTKMNMAKTLLLNTNKSVQEIAFASGFNDEKYFMRVFKQVEGMSPSQFRHAFFYTHMNAE